MKISIMILIFIHILISTPYFSQSRSNSNFSEQLVSKDFQNVRSQDWNRQFVSAPLGDANINGILIDPGNKDTWLVTSMDSGFYIYRFAAGGFIASKKMNLIK